MGEYPDPPQPPTPQQEWMPRILNNPDIEATKLLVMVGILESMSTARRQSVLNYLTERYL
jgi:hypothetical protein